MAEKTLVERLRKQPYNGGDDASLEAADALERMAETIRCRDGEIAYLREPDDAQETIAALRAENEQLKREISELPLSTTMLQNVTAERDALRAENERWKQKAITAAVKGNVSDRVLKDEISRLRAALEEIVENDSSFHSRTIASAALGGEDWK